MGGLSGMMGMAGGASGTGFSGPDSATVLSPVNVEQAGQSYKDVLSAQDQQRQFLTALQAQNGIQNQSDVYNRFGQVANGQGPNPAQAQLAQATAANTANQAALMAGQRGSSQNAGLIARQAAMQGAQNQQQSAGQAATLQANQSLAAMGQQAGLANQMTANQAAQTNQNVSSNQQEQSNLLNSIAGINQANVGMQSNINNVNGQLANTQLQGQQAMVGGLMNSVNGSAISSLLAEGGDVEQPDDKAQAPADALITPEQVIPASQPTPVSSDATLGAMNTATPTFAPDAAAAGLEKGFSAGGSKSSGGGGAMSSMMGDGGGAGLLALLADGGDPIAPDATVPANAPSSILGKYFSGNSKVDTNQTKQAKPQQSTPQVNYGNPGANALYQGMSNFGQGAGQGLKNAFGSNPQQSVAASGGPMDNNTNPAMVDSGQALAANGGRANKPVAALVSPGEQYLPPRDVRKVAKGANPLAVGERIPGQPAHPGNDYRNDVVPKTLESGGIVIPNAIMQSKNPHFEAMKFVHAHIAKHRQLKKGK